MTIWRKILIAAAPLIVWAAVSFVSLNPNPLSWEIDDRAFFLLFSSAVAFFIWICVHD